MRPAAIGCLGFVPGAVIIVTGSEGEIGRALARRAVEEGLTVAAWDLADRVAAAEEADPAGGTVHRRAVDVTDEASIAAGLEAARSRGPLRYLVNNAAPPAAYARGFAAGVDGVLGSVEKVTRQFCAAVGEDGERWRDDAAIVNVSSVAGTAVALGADWYAAGKAGVVGYTRYLVGSGRAALRVNCVAPGLIATSRSIALQTSDLGRRVVERTPMGRAGHADEVAEVALFLASPLASYVNGAVVVVDGGLLCVP